MIQKTFSAILLAFVITGSGLFFVAPNVLAQEVMLPYKTLPELKVKKDGNNLLVPFSDKAIEAECPASYKKDLKDGDKLVCYSIPWIAEYIVALYRWLVSIVGILAVMMAVWAGIRWMASAGNPEQVNAAKEQIMNAMIGILLLLGSYVFLNTINPSLTKLKGVIIPGVVGKLGPGDFCTGTEAEGARCGDRLSNLDGKRCAHAYQWSAKENLDMAKYRACCESGNVSGGKGGSCCVARTCDKIGIAEATCLQVGAGYQCVQSDGARGKVKCSDERGQSVTALQLWAACTATATGGFTTFLMASVNCSGSQAPEGSTSSSFCTACTGGTDKQQSYYFNQFNKDVLASITAQCGAGADTKFFLGVQMDDPDGVGRSADVYYVGHTGPLYDKPLDTLYTDEGHQLDAETLGKFNPEQGNAPFTYEELKKGSILFDATKRTGRWATD